MGDEHKNRGMDFEKMFSDRCKKLREDLTNKILINKVPTEMKLVRGAYGKIVKAFAVAKDQTDFVDFCGVYNGKAICFELKSTKNKTSFPFSNIKESQIKFLDMWEECGGMGFYLIRFEIHNRVFMIKSDDMHDVIRNINRKSVRFDYCLENDKFIELNPHELDFEKYIKE